MMPTDPLRQKMLFRTEWRSIGVEADTPSLLGERMNEAFTALLKEGFSISQVIPVHETLETGVGALIMAQRVLPAGAEPQPDQVPLPGTNAQQRLEIVYNFVQGGKMGRAELPTLEAAIRQAAADLDASGSPHPSGGPAPQPIGIHVSSITSYGPGDISTLRERYK